MYTASKDDTVANLKNSAQNLNTAIGETAENAKRDLKDAANKAGRKIRTFIGTAGDEITHATDTVTSQIRTNPVQSSLVALGVGVLLGALLRR